MSSSGKCPITHGWQPYDKEFRKDPFSTYKQFREQCPVGWVSAHDGFWAISRYEDIFDIARDPETFCSGQGIAIPPLEYDGRALPMEADAPEHADLRQILASELTPKAVQEREPMLRQAARSLLAEISDGWEIDLEAWFDQDVITGQSHTPPPLVVFVCCPLCSAPAPLHRCPSQA